MGAARVAVPSGGGGTWRRDDPNRDDADHDMSAGSRLPATPEPMHHWRTPGGLQIAGDAWGDPAGPLVVLQHGGGQTRHAWKGTGETLARAGYRAVALDARGHGDSDWAADGDYTQDAQVEDLVAVLDQLGGAGPVLVGASMGGGTSLVAVGEGHVDAAALVLVDIAPRLEVEGAAKIGAFMGQGADGFASLDEVADAIAAYQPHRPRPRQLDGLAKNVRLGADGRYHWHWDPAFRARTRDLGERHKRLEACAANLELPTLLVRGGLSDILTEEGAQEFLRLCPSAEYVSIAGAAHMVAGDRNDVFGEAVVDFLLRHVPVTAPAGRAGPATHHLPPGEHRITDVP
jgi:pimeloyl-ACP methyl ester carboxylesterase